MDAIPNFDNKCCKLRQESGFNFTLRESQVLVMAAADWGYCKISKAIHVSESAVRQFMKNSREKTCCTSNMAMAITIAKFLQ